MEKVIIIGCPGSGKTTFSKKLQDILNLPLYHLDAIWHKPDKTNIEREEFDEKIRQIINEPRWIIDGNYNRTLEMRLQKCDTVFLYDLPTKICIQGVVKRIGKKRDDLPWIEDQLDQEFIKQIEDFPIKNLQNIYKLLECYKNEKKIFIFKSRKEANEFLKTIRH